MFVGKQKTN